MSVVQAQKLENCWRGVSSGCAQAKEETLDRLFQLPARAIESLKN